MCTLGIDCGNSLLSRYADSRCDIGVAINEAFSLYAGGGVHVILGPCCDYAAAPVARQVTNSLAICRPSGCAMVSGVVGVVVGVCNRSQM